MAGGKGTRIAEETHLLPKPMINLNNKPMLLHIVDIYLRFNIREFAILAGYKIEKINEYFINNFERVSDKESIYDIGEGVSVEVLDTGEDTMTGGRIKRALDYFDDENFFLTYGDGLANINIASLKDFHSKHDGLATVTAVKPPARFGSLLLEGSVVKKFGEKDQAYEGWINGGFFIINRSIADYISDDSTVFEKYPMEQVSKEDLLFAFTHNGFWHPVDTLREKMLMDDYAKESPPPWLRDI